MGTASAEPGRGGGRRQRRRQLECEGAERGERLRLEQQERAAVAADEPVAEHGALDLADGGHVVEVVAPSLRRRPRNDDLAERVRRPEREAAVGG